MNRSHGRGLPVGFHIKREFKLFLEVRFSFPNIYKKALFSMDNVFWYRAVYGRGMIAMAWQANERIFNILLHLMVDRFSVQQIEE